MLFKKAKIYMSAALVATIIATTVPVSAAEALPEEAGVEAIAEEEAEAPAEEVDQETVEEEEELTEAIETDEAEDETPAEAEVEEAEDEIAPEETEEQAAAEVEDDVVDTSDADAPQDEKETLEETVETTEGKEAMLAGAGDVVDSGKCGDNLTWTLTGSGSDLTLTISGSGEMYDYPSYSGGAPWDEKRSEISTLIIEYGVNSIGKYTFDGLNNLEYVSLPDSLTTIKDGGFLNCTSLKSIDIPDSVTSIDEDAFCNCASLTSIKLPAGLTCLRRATFSDCDSLTSIDIPDKVTAIENSVFFDCNNLKSVKIPGSVTSIGVFAFRFCRNLTSVEIPDSVKSIDDQAFSWCDNLKSVKIPSSVTSMGYKVFDNSQKVVLRVQKNSYAQRYAKENGLAYAPRAMSEMTISGIKVKDFTGKAQTQSVVVKNGNVVLKKGTDYTVSYKNNTNVGIASVIITGKGDYSGSVTKTFRIRVPATTLSSVKNNGSLKMKAAWKTNTSVTGYQVQYSQKKDFSSGNKTITIKKKSQYATTVSGLTKGKKYYVRVRSYKTVNGKNYYSTWSTWRATTIRK